MEKLNLTQEWDKVFPKSDKGITRSNLSQPLRHHTGGGYVHAEGRRGQAARYCRQRSVRCGKGAVSGLYAQKMAELGFLTIAFDPSYTGESGGTPRYVASPDINTEDFCAAVDFLSVQENVDPERIGIIGICGWGGMAINAASIDTRIKATAAMTMYDMTRVTANGYFDAEDSEQARFEKRKALNAQRTEDYKMLAYVSRENLIIFTEGAAGDTAKKIMDGLAAENPELRSEQLLYRFFVRLLNGDMDCLSRLENEIDEYENVYLFKSESGKDVFEKLSAWRRELLRIKRYYEQLTLIFDEASANDNSVFSNSAAKRFAILRTAPTAISRRCRICAMLSSIFRRSIRRSCLSSRTI